MNNVSHKSAPRGWLCNALHHTVFTREMWSNSGQEARRPLIPGPLEFRCSCHFRVRHPLNSDLGGALPHDHPGTFA